MPARAPAARWASCRECLPSTSICEPVMLPCRTGRRVRRRQVDRWLGLRRRAGQRDRWLERSLRRRLGRVRRCRPLRFWNHGKVCDVDEARPSDNTHGGSCCDGCVERVSGSFVRPRSGRPVRSADRLRLPGRTSAERSGSVLPRLDPQRPRHGQAHPRHASRDGKGARVNRDGWDAVVGWRRRRSGRRGNSSRRPTPTTAFPCTASTPRAAACSAARRGSWTAFR